MTHFVEHNTLHPRLFVHESSVEAEARDQSVFLSFHAFVPEVYLCVSVKWHHLVCLSVVDGGCLACEFLFDQSVWIAVIRVNFGLNFGLNAKMGLDWW